ncbi:MAG: TonB family protein [Verrucomicrobia bacterium]|nr:TonB family protein [Verrucomicrobiota bacterium]
MRLRALLCAALGLSVVPAVAWADDPPKEEAPKKPVLVAPKQIDAPTVPYPEGATGSATVVVQVVVEKDGTVSDVTVVDGEEPFAAAAVANAKSWKFEPATRDGVAIRATIRAKVVFEPPVVATPEPPPSKEPEPPPAPGAPKKKQPEPPAVVDLTVEGERKEVGTISMGGGEIRQLPGAFGDPFRAIEALPGVTPIFSGVPFFYVRGAPPGNSGYLVDGVPVPMLFHLGAGPSVIAPGLIDRVDFFPSGYPARYGRFSGAIIAGETKGPATTLRGEWNIRLFDASALVESPIGDGKGTALVAGRYGYPGLLLSLLSPEVGLQYWDYQVRASRRVGDRDVLSTFVFGAYDKLTDKRRDYDLFDVQFHRVDLRWDHLGQSGGKSRLAMGLMFDQTGGTGDSKEDRVATRMFGGQVREEWEQRLSPEVLLRAGGDLLLQRFALVTTAKGSDGRDQQTFFPSRWDTRLGVRADLVIKPHPRVEIVGGARADLYGQGGTWIVALEPRLATRVRVARKVTWISTFGVAHQSPTFVVPVPGFDIATLRDGLQKAYQFAEGIEVELPEKVTVTTTAFYTGFLNLNDISSVCISLDDLNKDCRLDERVRGRAYGLELMLKRDLTQRLGGWLAYTLSRSERSVRGESFPSDFDRTHVLSAVLGVDLGRHWRFGGRFSYTSGRPVTLSLRGLGDQTGTNVTTPGELSGLDPSTLLNGRLRRRLPAFMRLDVRLEKRWVYSDTKSLAFVVEWFNAFLAKEPVDYNKCRLDASLEPKCELEEVGPVTIPSLGLEGTF